ncbi:MAG: bi-domain-containing oxidoreductase [Sedimentisphaerales bacterium]|nr:bi-domain-containing oxidoreductase [Sedimentisphaerales bacterium]
MRQVLQNLKTGQMELAEVPCPQVGRGQVLIQTQASLISAGTERMLVEFSKANLIRKARQQPDKVKQVLDKIKADGLLPTLEAVFRKLDQPLPLGYCNAGVVLNVGEGVTDLQPGDRVASNGNHAEIVCVPRNLVARIPDGVTDEDAAFTVLSSIALQGIRLMQPVLGEKIMVFGMGLIGLVTVQLLGASGCEVLGVDPNPHRLRLAEQLGVRTVDLSSDSDPVEAVRAWTGAHGVDGVLITACARTDEIVHQAAECCRTRGRIVLVGVVGLNLRRSDFYEKELTFQVSCSYGPGRYDEAYEQEGQDYPYGLVRWTEGRNFEAVLGAMANGSLNVEPLITHRYALGDAFQAYETIENDGSALGVILQYPEQVDRAVRMAVLQAKSAGVGKAVVGVIGAGNFAMGTILPCLHKTGARLKCIAGRRNGAALVHAAKRFGFENAVTEHRQILDDDEMDAVFIVTGHSNHASLVVEALQAGRHVFVEKPLAIRAEDLVGITDAVRRHPDRQLMVGFNRRFAAHTEKIRTMLSGRAGPLCMTMTVNAGEIPAGHWTQDPQAGGGRIIGEGCHFIDLLCHLAASPIATIYAARVGRGPAVRDDKMSIVLSFEDGSIGTVNYFANGCKRYPKETLEIFSDGRIIRLENFRVTRTYGFKRDRTFRTRGQDKGHMAEIRAFLDRVAHGGEPLIRYDELLIVTQASIAALTSAQQGRIVTLASEYAEPLAYCEAGK